MPLPSPAYVEELEATILQRIEEREEALERLAKAEAEKAELESELLNLKARLAFYENPNTPPSSRQHPKAGKPKRKRHRQRGKNDGEPKAKQGAPGGHKGATRKPPEPDASLLVTVNACPACHTPAGEPVSVTTRRITDYPPPQELVTTEYALCAYECACGHAYEAKHENCPQQGVWGVDLLAYTTMLRHHLRGPIRKVEDHLNHHLGLGISTKGVYDMLNRVSDACQWEHARLQQDVRDAAWLFIDETSHKVNGDKHWLWAFRTPHDTTLAIIRPSRGGGVLDEVLGPAWDKPVVVDGWTAYARYTTVQRCWSHLLRQFEACADTPEGKALHEEALILYRHARDLNMPDLDPIEGSNQRAVLDVALRDLITRYEPHDHLSEPLAYARNADGDWFTALTVPGMPLTNNPGEQAIREHVVVRKLVGSFRSEEGADRYGVIKSLLVSWGLQGLNPFVELRKTLRAALCLR